MPRVDKKVNKTSSQRFRFSTNHSNCFLITVCEHLDPLQCSEPVESTERTKIGKSLADGTQYPVETLVPHLPACTSDHQDRVLSAVEGSQELGTLCQYGVGSPESTAILRANRLGAVEPLQVLGATIPSKVQYNLQSP